MRDINRYHEIYQEMEKLQGETLFMPGKKNLFHFPSDLLY